MCIFNNCCCRDNRLAVVNEPFFCPRLQAYVIRGPRGLPGPAGPQGPSGLNGVITNNATFAQQAEVAVLASASVPFTTNYTLNGTKITHLPASTDIVLEAGTYLVDYSLSASLEGEGDASPISFALAINSVAQTPITRQIDGSFNMCDISGNAIITVPQNAILSLQNLSTVPVDVQNVVLSIVNLS